MPYDDQSELFCLVDQNNKLIGPITRKKAHKDKTKIHRSIFIMAINDQNQALFQKRSKHKDINPNYWTVSVSGHVTFGETFLKAAKKEFKEELGLKPPPLKYIAKAIVSFETETEFAYFYSTRLLKTPTNFDKTEVSQVKWVDINSLPKFIQNNPVTPGCQFTLKTLNLL